MSKLTPEAIAELRRQIDEFKPGFSSRCIDNRLIAASFIATMEAHLETLPPTYREHFEPICESSKEIALSLLAQYAMSIDCALSAFNGLEIALDVLEEFS